MPHALILGLGTPEEQIKAWGYLRQATDDFEHLCGSPDKNEAVTDWEGRHLLQRLSVQQYSRACKELGYGAHPDKTAVVRRNTLISSHSQGVEVMNNYQKTAAL